MSSQRHRNKVMKDNTPKRPRGERVKDDMERAEEAMPPAPLSEEMEDAEKARKTLRTQGPTEGSRALDAGKRRSASDQD